MVSQSDHVIGGRSQVIDESSHVIGCCLEMFSLVLLILALRRFINFHIFAGGPLTFLVNTGVIDTRYYKMSMFSVKILNLYTYCLKWLFQVYINYISTIFANLDNATAAGFLVLVFNKMLLSENIIKKQNIF